MELTVAHDDAVHPAGDLVEDRGLGIEVVP